MPDIRIGCSGFSYKHWKDVFYPHSLPERKWLEYYSSVFSSVELNVTFYHLPTEAAFNAWYRDTPPGFQFAVKGSRYITHVKRLVDPAEAVEKFFQGASLLKEKLHVILWQFPPAYKLNIERLSSFLVLLQNYHYRHAFEFRHDSWIVPAVIDLCRAHNAALCMADSPDYLDQLPVTSDFVYIRRHGYGARYAGRYSREQLAGDAARISRYREQGKDVFMYFNNDAYGYATMNALELSEMFSEEQRVLKKG